MTHSEIKQQLASLYAQKELITFIEGIDFFNKKVEDFLSDHTYPQAKSRESEMDAYLNSMEFHRLCWEIELGEMK